MDLRDPERRKIVLVAVIIAVCLAAGIGLGFASPAPRNWIVTTLIAVIMPLGSLRLFASAFILWRERHRLLGLLWGLVAVMLLLMTIAAWQYFSQLPPWPGLSAG
jgi:hypothetical protein